MTVTEPASAELLRIDPAIPVVWRDPQTLQFGVSHEQLRLHPVSETEERAVSMLSAGVHPALLAASVPPAELATLLERLDGLLERPRRVGTPVAVFGESGFAARFALAVEGVELATPLAVLVADWALPAASANRWLCRDERHLPLILSDGVLEAGPLVVPGLGPCLHCHQHRRAERDPEWPAIAAQLLRRESPALGAIENALAIATAVRWVSETDAAEPGSIRRLDLVSGREDAAVLRPHPHCRCAARQESDWGDGSLPEPS